MRLEGANEETAAAFISDITDGFGVCSLAWVGVVTNTQVGQFSPSTW
ncbi:MAG: hypothetical protein N2578_08035 [Bdellovibrionaceae bacterium]|nr:hypothetical protein [Pseudobdellovibrionaceae bacterium]